MRFRRLSSGAASWLAIWRQFALLACFAATAVAQDGVANATTGPWSAELNGSWRWHKGDKMEWASPSFNDSQWPVLRVPGPPPNTSSFFWLRTRVRTGALAKPALLVGPVAAAYNLYWDGKPVGSFGQPCTRWFAPRWQTFELNTADVAPGEHTLALRGCILGYPGARAPFILPAENRIGERAAIQDVETAAIARSSRSDLLQLLVEGTIFLAGLYFLLLPPSVAQGRAFRWFGAFLIGRACLVLIQFYTDYGPLAVTAGTLSSAGWIVVYCWQLAWIEFGYAFFRRSVSKTARCLEFLLLAFAIEGQ
jgi:hypothetical protein